MSFLPKDEDTRLKALHYLLIGDLAAESRYDSVRKYIAELLEISIEFVNLVDSEFKGLKSTIGLDTPESQECLSFCCKTCLGNEPSIVSDALVGTQLDGLSLAVNGREVRFFACLPIIEEEGKRIGTLCIKDHEPRQLKDWELEHLLDIAKVVAKDYE